jgi:protein SCO1/2
MAGGAITSALSEPQFAALVDSLAGDHGREAELLDLLREDHSVFAQRSAAAVVRMRGWVLLALAPGGVNSEPALLFLLEELDAGTDPYLVAAAARALRKYPRPTPVLTPFVLRALKTMRYRDDPVSFATYGAYADSTEETSPLQELFATLAWLGPHAVQALPELKEWCAPESKLSKSLKRAAQRAVSAIRGAVAAAKGPARDDCCALPGGWGSVLSRLFRFRRHTEAIEQTLFEDQDGTELTFGEFFRGQPSIVVFFYTRCDNPLKCSLTITKLARVQKLLAEKGLADRVRTAGITYDPAFDSSDRLRGYGLHREMRFAEGHRLLRAPEDDGAIRRHFQLGVNFIGSIVNRHRVEAFLLDVHGRVAVSFERLLWDEADVVERTAELLAESELLSPAEGPSAPMPSDASAPPAPSLPAGTSARTASALLGTLASLGVAFFPKCPVCWAAYLSMFGIASLRQIHYAPWLQPVLAVMMLLNLASVWVRSRFTGRMAGFYFVTAGALAIALSAAGIQPERSAPLGVALTFLGSVLSVFSTRIGAPATRKPRTT